MPLSSLDEDLPKQNVSHNNDGMEPMMWLVLTPWPLFLYHAVDSLGLLVFIPIAHRFIGELAHSWEKSVRVWVQIRVSG